jgi:hypothetical protein
MLAFLKNALTAPVKNGPQPSRRFRPSLEVLENRSLLTAGYAVAGGVLTITGDGAADRVHIHDAGTANGIYILLNAEPRWTYIGAPIRAINVHTHGGDDFVHYRLADDLQRSVVRQVFVDLGSGVDDFEAALYDASGIGSDLLTGSRLNLVAEGGDGGDRMQAWAGSDVDVHQNAALLIDYRGGDDLDSIHATFRGELDGYLYFYLGGQGSHDWITANLTFDAGSTGYLRGTSSQGVASYGAAARVDGNSGHDTLTFVVRDRGAAHVFARIDGDEGYDRGTRTANVVSEDLSTDDVIV